MEINQIHALLESKQYEFLRSNENLGENIILIGLGGSHAYGTNHDNSDVDIRGIATNSKRNILIGKDFEQVVDVDTDTSIYSFEHIIKLLCTCNPNTIEILGLKPAHYLFITPIGLELISNRKLFLSKLAAHSFGGYANAQLRRLENKSSRLVSQSDQEEGILRSIKYASTAFKQRYFKYPDDAIRLYVDKTDREGYESEIFMDVNMTGYPLRDFGGLWSEMYSIVKSFNNIGRRNTNAITHDKLGKHMMHLVRLYLMCFDLLENEEIVTYREKDHDLLMSIRNGDYLDDNKQPIPEFYELVRSLEKRFEYAEKNTSLPEHVDMNKINDFIESVNGRICSK